MLEKVVGAGKAIVRVSATLDFKQEEKTEEIFDPDSAVIRSEQRTDERSKGITPVAMGVPGVAANLPEESGKAASNVSSSDVRNTNETVNYEINKVVKRIIKPTGVIRRLSVAVLLDGTYDVIKGEDGKEEYAYVPRTDDEIKKYKNIVMKAVGYNAERGDQIEVTTTPFETVKLTKEEKKEMARDTLWRKIWGWIPYLATILLLALLVVVVLRPLVKWITRPEIGMITGISEGGASGELAERTPKLLREGVPGREQVARLAKADAELVAKGLRQWMS
jgi:flagellar M-ring protein FliF